MKVFSIALTLVALASSAPLSAQLPANRLPTTNRGVSVDGSWRVVGRDGNGNTIYERRTQDQYGNIIVQRARRDANGNMSIISSNTVGNTGNRGNRDGNNCDYNRTTNSIGDIIFGRTNDRYCDDVGSRVDGGWYQVGRGRHDNSEYVRRTRDATGNLVIQRARRDRNGNFRIISTRYATDNDKEWKKANKDYDKAVREADKNDRRDAKRYDKKGRDDNHRYDVYDRGDDRHGKGKGKHDH